MFYISLLLIFITSCSHLNWPDPSQIVLDKAKIQPLAPLSEVSRQFKSLKLIAQNDEKKLYLSHLDGILVFDKNDKFIELRTLKVFKKNAGLMKTPPMNKFDLFYNIGAPDYQISDTETHFLYYDIYSTPPFNRFVVINNIGRLDFLENDIFKEHGSLPLTMKGNICKSEKQSFISVDKYSNFSLRYNIKVKFEDSNGDMAYQYCSPSEFLKIKFTVKEAIEKCSIKDLGACHYLSGIKTNSKITNLARFRYCKYYKEKKGTYPNIREGEPCLRVIDEDIFGIISQIKKKEKERELAEKLQHEKNVRYAEVACKKASEKCHNLAWKIYESGYLKVAKHYTEKNCVNGNNKSCRLDNIIQQKISEKNRVSAEIQMNYHLMRSNQIKQNEIDHQQNQEVWFNVLKTLTPVQKKEINCTSTYGFGNIVQTTCN